MPTTQQRLCARSKMPGCCCLNNTGSKLLFIINWWFVHQGFNVAPREEVHWCEVCWQWRLSYWLILSNPKIVVSGGEMFLDLTCRVSRRPLEVWERVDMRTALTTSSAASLSAMYQGQWLYIWTSALNWYEIYLFFRILQWFYWFPTLVRPNLTVHTAARMHLLQIVPWQYIFVLVPLSPHEVCVWNFSTPCIYISIQYTYTFIQYIYYF